MFVGCVLIKLLPHGLFVMLKELEDLETRLRQGGLGGVPSFERWEKQLMGAKNLEDFVSVSLFSNICEIIQHCEISFCCLLSALITTFKLHSH